MTVVTVVAEARVVTEVPDSSDNSEKNNFHKKKIFFLFLYLFTKNIVKKNQKNFTNYFFTKNFFTCFYQTTVKPKLFFCHQKLFFNRNFFFTKKTFVFHRTKKYQPLFLNNKLFFSNKLFSSKNSKCDKI